MEVGGERHAPTALPPGKTRFLLYRRLGGPLGRPGRVRNISPPTGIRSPDRPARSETVYWLSYCGPESCRIKKLNYWTLLVLVEFDVQVTVHRDKFLWQNQLDALISQIYF